MTNFIIRCPDCGTKMQKAGKIKMGRTSTPRQNYKCPNWQCLRRTVNPVRAKE